jgi:thiol:disulfide interchange protein
MDRLKRFLAIPMALSAVGVLWLLYRLSGPSALIAGLVWSALLLGLLVAFGAAQRRGRTFGAVVPVLALACGVAAAATVPNLVSTSGGDSSTAARWSEARLASDVKNNRPAFVYFTADWCLTCKVNEAAAIDRSEVRDAFKQANVDVLAGDWTNGDPAITRFLESRQRAGVPLYIWYAPGKPAEELPQLLTPAMLIDRARSVKS